MEAAKHDGTSVVVVQQNCVIFNDRTHEEITDKENRNTTIVLRHGEKMLFGKNNEKGLVFEDNQLKVVTIGENGYTLDDILVHDAHNPNPGLHVMLTNMNLPDFPVALGVIRAVKHSTYDDNVRDQLLDVQKNAKIKCMDDLLHSGDTYEMK